jgi:hypothetical protein
MTKVFAKINKIEALFLREMNRVFEATFVANFENILHLIAFDPPTHFVFNVKNRKTSLEHLNKVSGNTVVVVRLPAFCSVTLEKRSPQYLDQSVQSFIVGPEVEYEIVPMATEFEHSPTILTQSLTSVIANFVDTSTIFNTIVQVVQFREISLTPPPSTPPSPSLNRSASVSKNIEDAVVVMDCTHPNSSDPTRFSIKLKGELAHWKSEVSTGSCLLLLNIGIFPTNRS